MKSLSVVTNGTGSVMGHFPTSKLQLWRGITNNKWLIDTLEMSYCLQFHHRPPLCTHTWPTVVRQALAISLEVLKQLEKGVIELVNPQIHPGGFHSKYFIKNTCLQERWKFQAHPGPQMPKQESQTHSFLHAACHRCLAVKSYQTVQVVYFCESEGCIFPHHYCTSSQKISSV